jgi:hypothetical protein
MAESVASGGAVTAKGGRLPKMHHMNRKPTARVAQLEEHERIRAEHAALRINVGRFVKRRRVWERERWGVPFYELEAEA